MKALGDSHTAYDVMREYMIIGAELDGKYQIPMLDRYTGHPGEDTVDFKDSFSLKIKNHRKLTVNFYIHDYEFEKIWNNPDRYLEHLKCFHSVIGPDFSMSVGENGMPFAMNIYQKYRNHALSHYLSMNGIKVIPNVSIPPEYCYDWAFDGVPKRSTVACCTNGRIKSRVSREEFCMCNLNLLWANDRKDIPVFNMLVLMKVLGLLPSEMMRDNESDDFGDDIYERKFGKIRR